MNETPQVVIRTRRPEQAGPKTFSFTPEMVRSQGVSEAIAAYRRQAWEVYQSRPMPTLKDEAWRRTDLSRLQAETFRLAGDPTQLNLAPVPSALLEPLTGGAHGGEIILTPGQAQVTVSP